MIANSGPETAFARIDLAETADFDLGGLRVSPARREVCLDSARRELEPKVAQVLVALAAVRPQVVSRDRLIEQCWDGRIVGDDALNRCIVALRHLAREFSPPPFAIETVSRVGYCLIERPADGIAAAAAPAGGKSRAKRAVAALLALVAVTTALGFGWSRYGRADAAPASIAVLPFRNLSSGEPYFAQGIGEEILGQLAREPQFRVAGGTSSSQFGKDPDVRQVARKLGVEFVVDGSVRTQGDRVRVNAALLKASDGSRMWSESFDGDLDDIFAIQQRIGGAVALALKRKLTEPVPGGGRAVNGEVYSLYLMARGMVRTGNPDSGHEAVGLLRQAMRIDPDFAPAWTTLAEAMLLEAKTRDNEGLIAIVPQARAAARHALELDRKRAAAHGVFADLIGSDTPQGMAHLAKAIALEPRTSEAAMRQSIIEHATGRFDAALASYQRAHAIDPAARGPLQTMIDLNSGRGDRAAAEAIVRRDLTGDAMLQNHALARIAWVSGDFSEAERLWSLVATTSSRYASPAKLSLENLRYALKLSTERPSRARRPGFFYSRFNPHVWMTAAPKPAEWQRRNRSNAAELVYRDENEVAAKLMLTAGRSKELLAAYDGPIGLVGMHRNDPAAFCRLVDVPTLVLALRAQGRSGEADALLSKADRIIRQIYGHGKVPAWFEDDAAGVWAVQGRTALALGTLERAQRRGWMHVGHTDLQLADEPAWRALRGTPRFEVLRARLDAHMAKEKSEIAAQRS